MAPQFLGPQIEDIILALNAVTVECNLSMHCLFSTLFSLTIIPCIATDNPLFNIRQAKSWFQVNTFNPSKTLHAPSNDQTMSIFLSVLPARLGLKAVTLSWLQAALAFRM